MQRRNVDAGPRVRIIQASVLLALAFGIATIAVGELGVARAPATAVVSVIH
jgi:hypothetical protein